MTYDYCKDEKVIEVDCPHCGGTGRMEETCLFCVELKPEEGKEERSDVPN